MSRCPQAAGNLDRENKETTQNFTRTSQAAETGGMKSPAGAGQLRTADGRAGG